MTLKVTDNPHGRLS